MMDQVRQIDLPKLMDARGNLSFIENSGLLPFDIKRVFWTYDVPGGESRGGHAYREAKELIIALSGSFDVVVEGPKGKKVFQLNRSYYGLYLPAQTWKHLENFSTNSLCLSLISTSYDRADYIYDFDKFKALIDGSSK